MSIEFLKYAAIEPVTSKQLRDWIVEHNASTLDGLYKLAAADKFTVHEPVQQLFNKLLHRYMDNVKNAGINVNDDNIAKQILKLSDDLSNEDLLHFWDQLSDEQRWLFCIGLPESIYRFQKHGQDTELLAMSVLLKSSGMNDLSDLILDDYFIVDKFNDLLDKIINEAIK